MTSSAQSVLVTGAGGFVCSHIVSVLLASGYQVFAIDRAFDPAYSANWKEQWPGQLEIIETDSNELPSLKADYAIHGAAITASPEELGQTPEANLRANLDPALALLEWAEQQKVQRVILLSSSAVYQQSDPGPLSEDTVPDPIGTYAVAKRTLESLAATLRAIYKRDVSAVRLSNIYGFGEHARPSRPRISLVGRMLNDALTTGKVTVYREDPARDWTFAPDIGHALCALLEKPTLNHALYNLASEQLLTPVNIAQSLQAHLPELKIDIQEGTDPALPPLTRHGFLSSERLRRDTGFSRWTPFAKGIRQVIELQRALESAI